MGKCRYPGERGGARDRSHPQDNGGPRWRAPGGQPRRTRRSALGSAWQPDDIAGAVLFLLSGLATWVTGQVLAVDGGSSARPSFLDADNLPVFLHNEARRSELLHADAARERRT